MEEFKGTPGPWEVTSINGIITGVGKCPKVQGGTIIEMVAQSILPDSDEDYLAQEEQIKADFTLIAAAPVLLEALQKTTELISQFDGYNGLEIYQNAAIQYSENLKLIQNILTDGTTGKDTEDSAGGL